MPVERIIIISGEYLVCRLCGTKKNDNIDPIYGVVLEIGQYRYSSLTVVWLGCSISLIPLPIPEEEGERSTVGDNVAKPVGALSEFCSCDVILCSSYCLCVCCMFVG